MPRAKLTGEFCARLCWIETEDLFCMLGDAELRALSPCAVVSLSALALDEKRPITSTKSSRLDVSRRSSRLNSRTKYVKCLKAMFK